MYRTRTVVGGKRIVIVGVAVAMFTSAGIAAAASGDAPWSGVAAGEPLVVEPTPVDPAPAAVAADGETLPTDSAPASPPTDGTDAPTLGDPQPVVTVPPPVDTTLADTAPPTPAPTDTTGSAAEPPVTEPPTSEPVASAPPAAPPADEPTATDAPPPAEAPTTTEFHDTEVPQGIALSCTADGGTVTCNWSVGTIPGFARFLLLRGNGGAQGRVPFQTSDPSASTAIDSGVPDGSYSYVVIAVDGNSKNLVHSNPVIVQIGVTG